MRPLERRILESMVSLRESEADVDRHMFVFPTSAMPVVQRLNDHALRIVRADEVALLCREPEG